MKKKLNILVLNPPFLEHIGKYSRTSRSPSVTKGGTVSYPFWLAYATGILDNEGFNTKFIDAPARRMSIKDVFDKLQDFQPNMVVMETSTPSVYSDAKCAKKIKSKFPESFIVFVGTHASALPEDTLELTKAIDAIARKEYDYTIRDLALALETNKDLSTVLGITYRKNQEIIHNKERPLIENLDKLPFVSSVYHKYLDCKDYFFAAAQYPMIMIITGRGCPFRCFFCQYPQVFHSRRYRLRSAQNVVDEFIYIKKNFPEVKEIGIEDDTFTANRNRTHEICNLLIKHKLKVKWYCNVRVQLDLATMKLMKAAGCRLVTVGFESADSQVLKNMNKDITVKQIKDFVKNSNKAKLLVHGCFIAGSPGETKQTLKKNLSLALQLNCDTMQFLPLQVYPGTESYEWARSNNYLTTNDFSKWITSDGEYSTTISLPNLPKEELVKWCNDALKAYYLRPSYLLYKLKLLITHPHEIARTFKSFIQFVKQLKSSSRM